MFSVNLRPYGRRPHQPVRGRDGDDVASPVLGDVLPLQEPRGGLALPCRGPQSGAVEVRVHPHVRSFRSRRRRLFVGARANDQSIDYCFGLEEAR